MTRMFHQQILSLYASKKLSVGLARQPVPFIRSRARKTVIRDPARMWKLTPGKCAHQICVKLDRVTIESAICPSKFTAHHISMRFIQKMPRTGGRYI